MIAHWLLNIRNAKDVNAGTTVMLVLVVMLVAGCKSSPQNNQPLATRPAGAEAAPSTRPDTMDAALTGPAMLARKTQDYTHDLQAMLAQRHDSPKPQPAQDPEPSEVAWADPKSLPAPGQPVIAPADNKTQAKPETQGKPVAKPVLDSAPVTANQVASLTPSAAAAGVASLPPQAAVAPPRADAVAGLEQKLAQGIKENPRDTAMHLDHQLLEFVKGESIPQMQTLSSLPEEDREMLSALLDGLSNFRNLLRADNNLLLSRKVRPLIEMADRLRSQADLTVPTAVLCTRVDGFGVYEPVEPARFIAGKEHPVIIYCEVENFASHQNDKKQWETTLRQEEVLYTELGVQVWPEKPAAKTITDLSRNRRHDFFVVKLIKLPAALTLGRYLLKVSIIDEQAARVAEATIPIQIVAQ